MQLADNKTDNQHTDQIGDHNNQGDQLNFHKISSFFLRSG